MTRAAFLAAAVAVLAGGAAGSAQAPSRWTGSFDVNVGELTTSGENPYFILTPGFQLTLEGRESGARVRLVITVLDETKNVGGVETRIVEERESSAGALVEVSRNYFAIHPRTHDVFYFGEDVDNYRRGKIVSHDGSWHHGEKGARFGLMMPGAPAIGRRYYQEQAPRIAMDRAEIIDLTRTLRTPAGTFQQCLETRETTPLEPGAREIKMYAPGVGVIRDGSLTLVSVNRGRQERITDR